MSLEEARRRIKLAHDTRATTLDLSGCDIDELPPEIQELPWLEELRVYGKEYSQQRGYARSKGVIKTIPAWIGGLVNLQVVSMRGQQLTALVPEIFALPLLQHLDIGGNQLTALPADIQNLSRLEYLNMSDNQLTTLPGEIQHLTQLHDLNISNNQIVELPAELCRLARLQRLFATNNKLATLSPDIQYLRELQILYLRSNHLTELPKEIQYLSQLKQLNVSDNRLTALPAEIQHLGSLQELKATNNRLTLLPPEIGRLAQLKKLDLSENQLTALPSELQQLARLESLDVSSNQLTALLPELQRIDSLQFLLVDNNPTTIPAELVSYHRSTHKPLLSYLRQLSEDGARPLLEAKLTLLGEGTVGKTSLVRRLLHDGYDPAEAKTEGIAIARWPLLRDDGEVRLNVWDFGGQEIMHATHQFFLTKRSVYLLVINCRASAHENRLDYWLKLVQSFAPDAPVIVVGNKVDQHALDLDQRGLMLKYPQIKGFVATSCATGAGIAELRAAIAGQLDAMKHIRDVLPVSWWAVKQQLESIQRDYISHERFQELCAQQGIDDDVVQTVLLGLLNDLGTVLSYHDDPRLAETNVLNPEWVTNGVYTLLNHAPLLDQRSGLLSAAELTAILGSKYGGRYPASKCHFISEMMEKFELCFRIERDQWLIPDLLPREEPDTGGWDEALHFVYRYPVLPGSIISRFIVRFQHAIEGSLRWRTGVVLRSGANRALVKADPEDARIDIRIAGDPANRRRFLSAIRHTFEQIHASLAGLRPDIKELVPLPGHPDQLVDYEDLLGLESMDEQNYLDGRLKKRFPLRQLLDGYESQTERQGRQVKNYDQDPLDHLQALLETKQSHLRDYELQKASFGALHVPPYVNTQIEQLTGEIARIREALERRLRGGR